jgi:hypothetical protein
MRALEEAKRATRAGWSCVETHSSLIFLLLARPVISLV